MNTALDQVLVFLVSIGLPVVRCEKAHGFIEHVQIVAGVLHVDQGASSSNVLHEAGHLAVIPRRFRSLVCGDLESALKVMMESIDWSDPTATECRMALQCGETEATAWAWAAGVHLGLAPEEIIANENYDGTGDVMRLRLEHDAYLGINGICHAGFCGRGELGRKRGQPIYPKLAYWLQGGPAESAVFSPVGAA